MAKKSKPSKSKPPKAKSKKAPLASDTEIAPKGEDADEEEGDDKPQQPAGRDEELCHDTKLLDKVRELAKTIDNGFKDMWDRGNDQLDYWDLFDCVLGGKQAYAGNSQIFVPIVREAVEARKTRYVNQLFPRSARNVECITSDEKPYDILALLEHYIRKTKMRTQIVPALVKNGDIEGQYNIYMGWENSKRNIVVRKKSTVEVEGEEVEDPDGEEDDVEEKEVVHMCPTIEVLSDCDVLVLPHTANSVGSALQKGGSATIIRRWSKSRIEQAIDDGEIDETEGEEVLEELSETKDEPGKPDAEKKHVDAAGIHQIGGAKTLLLYETFTYMKVDGKRRLMKILYAGGSKERVLSIKRNPFWNDKCPLLSAPVDKIAGVFKGQSKLKPVADLQYAANDAINEAWDSAAYSLMPIVMTDPSKNPRVGSMILNLAAIWETDPQSTQFAKFPELWKDGFAMVASAKTEIFQALSVSPAAIPQSTGGKSKRNQAEIAAEQQIDILTTADVCTNLEDEILTPILRWMVELDYQFREEEMTVREYGQMGLRANMQKVPPIQSDRRYEFKWFGVEAARNAQTMQQQIATLNVVKGIPPQQYEGYTLNAVPIISQLIENTFGSRLAPQIFESIRDKLTVSPEQENEYLEEGLSLPVHVLDDDQKHMQEHVKALRNGDPTGAVREHMMRHRMQMDKKMQMQEQQVQSMQRGAPGGPGGAGPGVAGTPRPGAQPGQPRGGQNPPGAVHQDRMQGPGVVPRR